MTFASVVAGVNHWLIEHMLVEPKIGNPKIIFEFPNHDAMLRAKRQLYTEVTTIGTMMPGFIDDEFNMMGTKVKLTVAKNCPCCGKPQ